MARRREPAWVDRLAVEAMHFEQLREHGGLPGIRDETVLGSALERAHNRWLYEPQADLATLAAAYGWGLATSHPFRDGNKRIAFLTMAVFSELNGYRLEASEDEVVRVMVAIAGGNCAEEELAEWLRGRLVQSRYE